MSQGGRERRLTIPQNIVCWLDTKTNQTNEDICYVTEQLFMTWILILTLYLISEPIDEQFLSLLDSINQIKSIYLVCHNALIANRDWTNDYRKVKLTSDKIEKICLRMEKDIRQYYNDSITFQTFTQPTNSTKLASNDLNSSFMYSQLIKEMLGDPEVEYDQDYIDTFTEVCRAENQDNYSQMWYTKESFLYLTLNRALRTQDVTKLFMMAFFIRDLHLQLIKLQQANPQNQSLQTVYRGQGKIESELQRLRENISGLLSFNNFLSTSSDYDVSLMFARSARDNPEHIGILFRMNINSRTEIECPYASLHGVSFYPDENEILFSMHTIFRIIDVRQIETRLWVIELDLTNDKDQQLTELLGQLRSEIHVAGVFNVDKLGQLSLKMGDYDGALEVYQTLLRLFPDNQALLTYVHHHLGLVYQAKNDFEQAIVHYKKAIDIRRSFLSETEIDRYSIVTYANLSSVYVNTGDLARARQYCERALTIYMQYHHGEEYDPIIHCYHLANLAYIQQAEGNSDDALINYRKVIDLRLKYISPYHPDLVVAYNNLAMLQASKKSYADSIESLQHALEISRKSLPDNHEILANIHHALAVAFGDCQKYEEALKHIQSATEIAQQLKSFDKTKLRCWESLVEEFRQNLNIQ